MTDTAKSRQKSTRDKILDAAEAQFAARGYAGTRLDEIANIVDIKRPSLLYHFPNKGELYVAVLERLFEPQIEIMNDVLSQSYDSELKKLQDITRRWITWVVANSHYTSMLMHHAASAFRDEFDFWQRSSTLVSLWDETLKKGIKKGEVANVSSASVFSLITGYTAFYLVLGKEHEEKNLSATAFNELTKDLMHAVDSLLVPEKNP